MQKMTQERLENLIERSLKMKPTKDHAGHLHLRLNPAIKLGSDEAHLTNLDLVVQFILDDKDNGNRQTLEILGFIPVQPDKSCPLTVNNESYLEAVEFCSKLSKKFKPEAEVSLKDGNFYSRGFIVNPTRLSDDFFEFWLKRNLDIVITVFTEIYQSFGNKSRPK